MTQPTRREVRARRALAGALLAGLGAALATVLIAVAGPPPRYPAAAAGPRPQVSRCSVDLATAPAWQLTLIPGIGAARAHAIVAERERSEGAALRSVDDLLTIRGIGPALIRRLRRGRLPVRVLIDGRPVQRDAEAPDGMPPAPGSLPTMGP
jgi:hypothetical protein